MMSSVTGTTNCIRSWARTMYSYWPLHPTLYPVGMVTFSATARWALCTYVPTSIFWIST